MPKPIKTKYRIPSYFNTQYQPQFPNQALQSQGLYQQLQNIGSPEYQNQIQNQIQNQYSQQPTAVPQQAVNSHVTPQSEWAGGFSDSYNAGLANTQHGDNQPIVQQQKGLFDQLKDWSGRPTSLTEEEFGGLDADGKIKAGALPSNLKSMLGNMNSAFNFGSGLYGLYAQHENKKAYENEMNRDRAIYNGSEKNRSAIAAVFGSTYTPTYV